MLLKSLARARADGDQILAVITGSAVNQGSNCTPITVPVSDSQSTLYKKALAISGTDPKDVGYVEAHGTGKFDFRHCLQTSADQSGTPVGDPIECESIRRTFGGPNRTHELFLGSVKDNVGHTESASGAAALIKTILMMQKRAIPKQANFKQLNPKIAPLGPDHITIPTQTQTWSAPKRIAVVNNYGAAGSNAAIVVQAVHRKQVAPVTNGDVASIAAAELPFFISAKTSESLREYCLVLRDCLQKMQESDGIKAALDLAYNLSVKQNRGFEYSHIFTASTLEEVAKNFDKVASIDFKKASASQRSIVLCIGGQSGRTVHLDEGLFRKSTIFQKHIVGGPTQSQDENRD